MTITIMPVDATAGSPQFTAKNYRQAQAGLYGGGGGRALGTRSGHRPDTPASVLTATSTAWTLNPLAVTIDPGAALYNGVYGWASDTAITGSVDPADANNPRMDAIYIQVNDSSAGDGSGALSAPVLYVAGAPAATPVAPDLPERSWAVGWVNVPKVGGGNPTTTLNTAKATAAGGVIPVSSLDERNALVAYPGMVVAFRGALQLWDGSKWSGVNTSVSLNPNDANWSVSGGTMRSYDFIDGGSQVRTTSRVTRVAGPNFNITRAAFQQTFTNIVPIGWRPSTYVDAPAYLVDNLDAPVATLQGRIGTDGSLIFRVDVGPDTVPVNPGYKIFFDAGWWI